MYIFAANNARRLRRKFIRYLPTVEYPVRMTCACCTTSSISSPTQTCSPYSCHVSTRAVIPACHAQRGHGCAERRIGCSLKAGVLPYRPSRSRRCASRSTSWNANTTRMAAGDAGSTRNWPRIMCRCGNDLTIWSGLPQPILAWCGAGAGRQSRNYAHVPRHAQ